MLKSKIIIHFKVVITKKSTSFIELTCKVRLFQPMNELQTFPVLTLFEHPDRAIPFWVSSLCVFIYDDVSDFVKRIRDLD